MVTREAVKEFIDVHLAQMLTFVRSNRRFVCGFYLHTYLRVNFRFKGGLIKLYIFEHPLAV
jgi:hypothetical protein